MEIQYQINRPPTLPEATTQKLMYEVVWMLMGWVEYVGKLTLTLIKSHEL